jgi:ketosteroid isomerase-like protein
MTDIEIQDFVTRFAAAWADRDGEAFLALWHPDGVLHSPLYDRAVAGKELGRLTEIVKKRAPDSVWQLLDWTARGDTIMVEWQNTRTIDGKRFDWRGVDKFRLRDGRIVEERVYADTAPLRAVATGRQLDAIVALDHPTP